MNPKSKCRTRWLVALLLLAAAAVRAEPAGDPSTALSNASVASLEGGAALASGVVEGASFVLVALEPLGEGASAVFEAVGGSTRVTLELSGEAAVFAGRHVGEAVEVVASAGGFVLQVAGETIAFVPNELNRSLHHRRRLGP